MPSRVANTNQVGGHFRRQLATFDNPVVGLFVLHKACDVKYLPFSLAGYEELARGLSQSEKEEYFELMYNKVLLLACIE